MQTKKRIVYVDADSCPVKQEIMVIAQELNYEVIFVTSYSHHGTKMEASQTVFVDNEKEAVDMYIVNHAKSHNVVVTQDHALASILLPKKARVLSPRGIIFSEERIESMLEERHFSQKQRRAGAKTKGPKKFTDEDRNQFCNSFRRILSQEEGK
ncbi:YaiI/YqxD family protein [Alkalihalobacillus sp. LMS39]|uniref:YaiI/YqxD family protein n=1 Tax=Alkalihalobacillus sp. LMS39 TaxID=2924032 RepID=UPI001FB44F85|nr:YaiI/YqxD family protein [Alkalihalobacillus sp. LMS39]UOE95684.1 YaiI/YqxD family protein [Alkalihalobacillus sp. LMS39]